MKKFIILAFCTYVSSVLFAQDITGSWGGKLQIQNTELGIVFHIVKNDTVYETKMDSPDQGAFGLATSKTLFSGNQLEISASGMGISYTGTFQGDSITGVFRQGGIQLPLVLKPVQKTVLSRPQEPKPPFPYQAKDITFPNEVNGNMLAGTLTTPASTGIFPAVILIAGSGANDRDESIFGHKPFWVIADHLTRNGFAVLRYDKRGVAGSNGDYVKATTEDFASDAAAAFNFLKSQNNIDKKRITLIGHSEGGVIAPMVAASDATVGAIVLMAGMGVEGSTLLLQQNADLLKMGQIAQDTVDRVVAAMEKIHASLRNWKGTKDEQKELGDKFGILWESMPASYREMGSKEQYIRGNMGAMLSPWFRFFLSLNPAVYLEKVKCPVLAVNGEKDIQVCAPQNLQAIGQSLEKGGNKNYTIKSYPGLNHLFQECETGSVEEYGKIEQTISPQFLSDITDWLKNGF
jgi:pimeloyl-ACP methyl ester carboxylesterase